MLLLNIKGMVLTILIFNTFLDIGFRPKITFEYQVVLDDDMIPSLWMYDFFVTDSELKLNIKNSLKINMMPSYLQ